MLPFLPVLLAVVHVAAPGSLGTVLDPAQLVRKRLDQPSCGRSRPRSCPTLPRTRSSDGASARWTSSRPDLYRITDDQLLSMLWQTGVLGLSSYMWMIISPIVAARHARRSRDPAIRMAALAASAGCVAYLVVNGLFDTLSFVQAPYLFFILAAICTVASGAPDLALAAEARERRLLRPALAPA